MQSKAIEANLSDTKVDVAIDPRYHVLQEIVADYYGVLKRMNAFLTELSHPMINWAFVVEEISRLSRDLDRALAFYAEKDIQRTRELLQIPGYMDLVNRYRIIPRNLERDMSDRTACRHLKLMVLFYIIHVPDLAMIHEETLHEINRSLTDLIGKENFKHDLKMIDRTFTLLKGHAGTFPETVLDCIHRIGEAVYGV